jgi:hypothetical protein
MEEKVYEQDPRLAAVTARRYAAADTDWHIDAALSEMSIQFYMEQDMYLATAVMPVVSVTKQSDRYQIWDKDYWFKIPNTLRARATRANRVETAVSSSAYYAHNYALEEPIAFEDLDNADSALEIEASTARHVMQLMMLDQENRIATLLTTAANVGSGNTLSGTAQWSDRANSDPVSDVSTGRLWIQKESGMRPNTIVNGQEVHDALLLHPDIIDRVKYTQRADGATLEAALADILLGSRGGRYFVGGAPKQNAGEGLPTSASSMTFIWGKTCSIFYVPAAPGKNVPSAAYAFRWKPAGFSDFVVETKDDDDIKARLKRVNYFQDERITASQLIYGLASAVA